MPATALKSPARPAFGPMTQPNTSADTARRLFAALAPLHGLNEHDRDILARASAGCRFIRAMHPFGDNEQALMRIALADLSANESFIVEAAANCVADLAFEDQQGAWNQLCDDDRGRILWFAAILRLADGVDAVTHAPGGAIHVAWSDDVLHIEIDGVALSDHDLDRVLGRRAALEAATGRRVFLTSSARRRGAA